MIFALSPFIFLHIKCSDGYLSLFLGKTGEPYLWPKRIGGTLDDAGLGLASDSNNNIIITGYVAGSIDFNRDGDILDEFENDAGDTSNDIFIIKYSARGIFNWARRLGGTGSDKGFAVKTDSDDNIIVTGFITGNADLSGDGDTGEQGEVVVLGTHGAEDIFIVKFDSSGNYLWSRRLGGTLNDEGQGVVIDGTDIYISGIISGNADLDGNGSSSDGGAEDSTGHGGIDIFLSKFDSSGNNLITQRLGGSDLSAGDFNSAITQGGDNSIIIGGSVTLSADLNDNGNNTDGPAETAGAPYGFTDIFVSKFNSANLWQWSKRIGGSLPEQFYGITSDNSDAVILTGNIFQDADLNGNVAVDSGLPETATATYGGFDIFVSKFDSSGTWQWSKRLGGTSDENGPYFGNNITSDPADSVIVIGEVQGNADLDGNGFSTDGGAEDSSAYGNYDIFVTKFDNSLTGEWQWAKRIGGTGVDDASNVIVSNNTVFVTGFVTGNADLDGDGAISLIDPLKPADPVSSAEDAIGHGGYGGKDIIISVFPND